MQDDIDAAVEEQSAPLLRAALKRCHACPGEHALHEAVRQAKVGALRLLLQGRAEPNARCLCLERGCEFPLQLAASSANFLATPDRCQAVELLLQAGAFVNPRRSDAEANMPLHDAVRRGDLKCTQLLLRHGASPNAANGFGETPLCLALRLGLGVGDFMPSGLSAPVAIVQALLEAGASPLAADGQMVRFEVPFVDPLLRALLARWASWWRCRNLAWVRSRGRDERGNCHSITRLLPELLKTIGRFL